MKMFIVLYRWRVKPSLEQQFIESWAEITAYYRGNCDSLGSRLHRGSDGLFYAYAQWKSDDDRRKAFPEKMISEAGARMRQAILETFPDVELKTLEDFLILPGEN